MQSHNYVPGVSGWKMHPEGALEVNGVFRVSGLEPSRSQPFIVVDGVTYIPETEIERATIKHEICITSEEAGPGLAEQVRQVLRKEMRPGGILYRAFR